MRCAACGYEGVADTERIGMPKLRDGTHGGTVMDLQKVKEIAADIKYYVGNPSAWEHYDDFISEKIGALVEGIEALAELEKSADEDAESVLSEMFRDIRQIGYITDPLRLTEESHNACVSIIQQYAEAYHAKRCGECKETKSLYVKFGNEMPPDECLSCGLQCPNDCPLDKSSETPDA